MKEIFLTVAEITILLKVSRQAVSKWIKKGKLTAYKVDNRWRIKTSDLEKFLTNRRSY